MNSEYLARLARIHAELRQIKLATLGVHPVRDANVVERLKEGRVTIRRAALAPRRLSAMWPAPPRWPADIPRPAPHVGLSPDRDHAPGTRRGGVMRAGRASSSVAALAKKAARDIDGLDRQLLTAA